MGVKYSAQESQELIQAMTNNLQVANRVRYSGFGRQD